MTEAADSGGSIWLKVDQSGGKSVAAYLFQVILLDDFGLLAGGTGECMARLDDLGLVKDAEG